MRTNPAATRQYTNSTKPLPWPTPPQEAEGRRPEPVPHRYEIAIPSKGVFEGDPVVTSWCALYSMFVVLLLLLGLSLACAVMLSVHPNPTLALQMAVGALATLLVDCLLLEPIKAWVTWFCACDNCSSADSRL